MRDRLVQDKPSVADFMDEKRHHDAQEWVVALLESIGDLLPAALCWQWRQLFLLQIVEEYICDGPGRHQGRHSKTESILPLPVLDANDEHPIRSLSDAISNFKRDQWVEKRCGQCNSQWSAKRTSFVNHPQVDIEVSC